MLPFQGALSLFSPFQNWAVLYPACCPLFRGSHCLSLSNAVITWVLGVNFKAKQLKFYRHSPQDFRSSCVYFSSWNAFSKFLMVNLLKRLLAVKICHMMLLRKMNIHCLFNISSKLRVVLFFFHILLYCESLNTQVLWKPMSAEDRGENLVL